MVAYDRPARAVRRCESLSQSKRGVPLSSAERAHASVTVRLHSPSAGYRWFVSPQALSCISVHVCSSNPGRSRVAEPVQGGVEVFASSGRHEGKFDAAFASAVCCAEVCGSLVWLGLASGRVVAVCTRTRHRVATQDLHASAVVSLQQVPPPLPPSLKHLLCPQQMRSVQ